MGFKTFILNEGRSKVIDEYEAAQLDINTQKEYT